MGSLEPRETDDRLGTEPLGWVGSAHFERSASVAPAPGVQPVETKEPEEVLFELVNASRVSHSLQNAVAGSHTASVLLRA
jgi:hypothetical protein